MRTRQGFSLVETIIAMALTIMVIAILFEVFPMTRRGLQLSENHVNAAFLGRSLLDEVRATGFTAITPREGSISFSGTDNGAVFDQNIDYRIEVQALDTDKKLVWATMNWQESSGAKQLVLETILTRR